MPLDHVGFGVFDGRMILKGGYGLRNREFCLEKYQPGICSSFAATRQVFLYGQCTPADRVRDLFRTRARFELNDDFAGDEFVVVSEALGQESERGGKGEDKSEDYWGD